MPPPLQIVCSCYSYRLPPWLPSCLPSLPILLLGAVSPGGPIYPAGQRLNSLEESVESQGREGRTRAKGGWKGIEGHLPWCL